MRWQDSEEYKDALANLESCHKIAADLGMSNPANEAREKVLLEMRFAAWEHGVDDRIANQLANLVFLWKKERDVYYMDKALLLCCRDYGLPPSPALMNSIAEATEKRLVMGSAALKNKAVNIEKNNVKWRALLLMMNLIFRGVTLNTASRKVSQWMKDVLKVKPIMASSLEKYYTKECRKKERRSPNLEELYFDNWNKNDTDENRQQWEQLIKIMPDAEDELIGNRRD